VPPGLAAGDPERRQTYGAALRQAEELADAANAAGYAAKPLPLVYSLSQAGRAIVAAHGADPWRLHGHGVHLATADPDRVLETTVFGRETGKDSFSAVARTIGSPGLTSTVSLGALWAANPDLIDVPFPEGADSWPRAVHIPLPTPSLPTMPGMPAQDPETTITTTNGMLSAAVAVPGDTAGEVVEALQSYPSLRRARVYKQGASGAVSAGPDDPVERHILGNTQRVGIAIEVDRQMTMAEFWAKNRELASVVEIDATQPRFPAPQLIGYALPELAGAEALWPLMLWWALLYGLSVLARYEPAAWTAALDLDRSKLAVGLERVLDLAAHRVPERVSAAMRRH
jgi:hypothetical protein